MVNVFFVISGKLFDLQWDYDIAIYWLVVSTVLNNISQWEGFISYIMEK